MMPGTTFEEIQQAIEDAYDEMALKQLLRKQMNLRLDNEIPPGAFGYRVFELIQWAEMRGRDVELIAVTSKGRPGNTTMQQVYKKYGLAIPVLVQQGGAPTAGTPPDAADAGLERVVRPFMGFADFDVWLQAMTRVGEQVCRITISDRPLGTGFLVGPDTVLTNYHVLEKVINDGSLASGIQCEFDYKIMSDGSRGGIPVKLHPTDWKIDYSPYSKAEKDNHPEREPATVDELDYALVRLADAVGSKPAALNPDPRQPPPPRGWVRVPDVAPTFKDKMAVIIAQHPDGKPLKLALDTQAIDKAAGFWLQPGETRVRYATNTEGGSSGSPCFDFDWNLIALHHYGDPSSFNVPAHYNQGVPIHQIRDRIKRQGKADALGGGTP